MRWFHIFPRNNTSVRVGSAVSARSDLCEIAWNFYILFLAVDEVVDVMYVAPVTARAFHKAHPVGTRSPAVLFDTPWSSPWLGELDITTSLRGGIPP